MKRAALFAPIKGIAETSDICAGGAEVAASA